MQIGLACRKRLTRRAISAALMQSPQRHQIKGFRVEEAAYARQINRISHAN